MASRCTTSAVHGIWILASLALALLTGTEAVRAGNSVVGTDDPRFQKIVSLHAQARVLEGEGRLTDAAELYRQAVLEAHEAERSDLVAALLLAAGETLLKDRRIQDAAVACEQGLLVLEGDERFDVSDLRRDLRRLEKGVRPVTLSVPDDLYTPQAAASLQEAANDPELDVRLLLGIGNAYLEQPQPSVALEHYEQALARVEDPTLRASILSNTGTALRRLEKLDDAEERFRASLDLFAVTDQGIEGRAALSGLAAIQLERNEPDAAATTYRKAIDLYTRAGDESGLSRAVTGLARSELLSKRFERAVTEFERARQLARKSYDREALLHIYLGLGVAYRKVGRFDDAADSLEAALPEISSRRGNLRTDEGRIAFLDTAAAVYDELLEVHLARARTDPAAWADALSVSERSRGRALADLVGHRRRSEQMKTMDMVAQVALGTPSEGGGPEADWDAAKAVAGTPVNQDMRQTAVGTPVATAPTVWAAPNTAAINTPVADISQTAAGTPIGDDLVFAFEPEIIEPRERRQAPPVSRLSFHVLETSTAVFSVAPGGTVRGHVAPIGRADLEARVADLRNGLGINAALRGVRGVSAGPPSASVRPPEEILGELGRDLLGPFQAELASDEAPLALVLHGPLWNLPFAALADGSGKPLIAHRPLLFSSSWDLLDEIRREVPRDVADLKLLAVGNPAFRPLSAAGGLSFERLPHAEVEARAVQEMSGHSTLLTGSDATLERVVSSLSDHEVIHLATHGVASDEDPLSSFLLFAGDENSDRLSARTVIRDLDVPAELVVLSACQTGLGRLTGDGMIGLSRSFLAAGARTVVVSLWSVSDEATEALMRAFYRAYLVDGVPKAAALRQAMLSLQQDPEFSSPAFWAPFILIGAED